MELSYQGSAEWWSRSVIILRMQHIARVHVIQLNMANTYTHKRAHVES